MKVQLWVTVLQMVHSHDFRREITIFIRPLMIHLSQNRNNDVIRLD